jgi:hypothetical protein
LAAETSEEDEKDDDEQREKKKSNGLQRTQKTKKKVDFTVCCGCYGFLKLK